MTDHEYIWGKPWMLIFDTYETLFNFGALTPAFIKVFRNKNVLQEWLVQLRTYSLVIRQSNFDIDYLSLGISLCKVIAEQRGIVLSNNAIHMLTDALMTVPPYPDVETGLRILRNAGFRMVLAELPFCKNRADSLRHRGLDDFFEKRLYGPPIPGGNLSYYQGICQGLDVPPAACCLISTHRWATITTKTAGLASGFLNREKNKVLLLPGIPSPDITSPDLITMAGDLALRWR